MIITFEIHLDFCEKKSETKVPFHVASQLMVGGGMERCIAHQCWVSFFTKMATRPC